MMRCAGALPVLVLLASRPGQAQSVRATAFGAAATNSEVTRTRQARGLGIGGAVQVDFGRMLVTVRGLTASLQADFSVQPDYAMRVIEAVATYRWRPPLDFEVGLERRWFSPDFAAQNVGLVRLGVHSASRLSSLGTIEAHLAYLPFIRFSGGGDASLGGEIGLGVMVGQPAGRIVGLLDYTYQRIDRHVNSDAARISYAVARAGIATRF